ncbi:uncharacterized protein Nmag_1315 [Natrialba magadii ATCC 43099]|uniref:Uncharacterized protein n=1 Tax=Natrialba magadii (strain ATCC 43099 / DSM 3394 / CCM 3739 / CIP 104546 / IAM 13178 / JCM 8861 / NBRC 102185 / NCIMB 2190 / MS3) TaxID=547559 RepID=D3SSU8_NATMM|nr:hypothetical protein [Natrialba magadii]ADD04894.1 uncharacterized protein Nmag_1315 [Natrialba magadii ATCC 43099]ELY23943.1 hypothetical protein C500_19095 [Natrialba magadii ATCC 43099]
MSEYTSTDEPTPTADESFADRTPPMHPIVTDATPPRDRSLPVSLCRLAGVVGRPQRAPPEQATDTPPQPLSTVLPPLETALSYFEAYVRLRLDLLLTDRYPDTQPRARDAAILASDFLHAGAYAAVADAPLSEQRTLELYRVLTRASTQLSHQLLAVARSRAVSGTHSSGGSSRVVVAGDGDGDGDDGDCDGDDGDCDGDDGDCDRDEGGDGDGDNNNNTEHNPSVTNPLVTLSETAAELGSIAAGASADTRAAMTTYGGSLTAALTAEATRESDIDSSPVAAAVDVLSAAWTTVQEREQEQDQDTATAHETETTLSFVDAEATETDVYRHYRLPSLSSGQFGARDCSESEREHEQVRVQEQEQDQEQDQDQVHVQARNRDAALESARDALRTLDNATDATCPKSIRTALERATRVPGGDTASLAPGSPEPIDDD